MQEFLSGLKKVVQIAVGIVVIIFGIVVAIHVFTSSASCMGSNCPSPPPCTGAGCPPQPAQPAQGAWSVTYEVDPENPASQQPLHIARTTQGRAGGGTISVIATCRKKNSIELEFDSFGKDSKPLDFEYSDTSDNKSELQMIYRLDSGHLLLVSDPDSKTRYSNVAEVDFSYVTPDYEPADIQKAKSEAGQDTDSSGNSGANFGNALLGLPFTPLFDASSQHDQDIIAFLTAHAVNFQLPIKGGVKELVEVDPQDPSFQDFVSKCQIDLKQLEQSHQADLAAQNMTPLHGAESQDQQPQPPDQSAPSGPVPSQQSETPPQSSGVGESSDNPQEQGAGSSQEQNIPQPPPGAGTDDQSSVPPHSE